MTVYTDPREPGAPQVGDLVVVVQPEFAARHDRYVGDPWTLKSGDIGVVDKIRVHPPPWTIRSEGRSTYLGQHWAAVSVRHPTPEELAAYQLAQGAS